VLVLDLREHDEAWVRGTLGDHWLGFSEDRLRALIGGAGFADVTVRVGARRQGDPFSVLVAAGTNPRPVSPPVRRVAASSRRPRAARPS
jgi:hypothetical protein